MTEVDEANFNQVVEVVDTLRSVVESNMTPSREKSLALTKLDECIMWVSAGFPEVKN